MRLTAVLTEAGLHDLAGRARHSYYDGCRSALTAPIEMLVEDLLVAGRADLAELAMNGEFDNTPEEIEAWNAAGRPRNTTGDF